ncbi:tRNA epoxyqueuosine(34) reductase QueG [Corallococcus macrosporus]|uniref:Putative iron-sulfur cluster binding protein n=1 Tax=Myxococcus fulvus (strain ATCC BAA-855 / HW-1) TaxID=483219 RepID=F8CL91_MYXFH|nr:tRNA epoxyqueuosine(34) reductase QueG [Corallococcus macrosporus]AEI65216.1 putative iron-sulfur cluster binding protein [Corallococcus macrosporus]
MTVLPTAHLRDLASSVGFDLVGFARAEPIPPDFLLSWVAAGYAADMDWMGERAAERLDVSVLLPGARTVISFANNYWRDDAETVDSPIARYARGRDYHSTLRDRMKAFRKALTVMYPGLGTYGGVDSGPLMEKVWAARAGLGYVGKNGCFITEPYGSWVLLATLVLDVEVDDYGTGPAADRCGACRRCLVSCPTGALVGNGRVDARACLSYQTIENREQQVPEAFRLKFDNLIFGCDICQQVCPLNRRPVFAEHPRFAPRAVAELGVRELAGLTVEQYEHLIPGTALARARYDGLRRNAVYALGVAKQADAKPLLEKLCGDSSELVRTAAQWALLQLDP